VGNSDTVELERPFVPETTTYSVSRRRATTADDREVGPLLVEHAQPLQARPRRAATHDDAPGWEVVRTQDRIVIQRDDQAIELSVDDARVIVELLVRATR